MEGARGVSAGGARYQRPGGVELDFRGRPQTAKGNDARTGGERGQVICGTRGGGPGSSGP